MTDHNPPPVFVETLEKPRGHGEGSESDILIPIAATTAGGGAGGGAGGLSSDKKDVRRPSLLKAGSIRHPKGSLSLSGKQISGKFASALGQGLGGLGGLLGMAGVHSGSSPVHSIVHEEEGEQESNLLSNQHQYHHHQEELPQHSDRLSPSNTNNTTTSTSANTSTNNQNNNITTGSSVSTVVMSRSTRLAPLKEGPEFMSPKEGTTPVVSPSPSTATFKKSMDVGVSVGVGASVGAAQQVRRL